MLKVTYVTCIIKENDHKSDPAMYKNCEGCKIQCTVNGVKGRISELTHYILRELSEFYQC